jgi:hypothetical protein
MHQPFAGVYAKRSEVAQAISKIFLDKSPLHVEFGYMVRTLLLLTIVSLFAAGCSDTVVTGPPRIEFRERVHDFGEVTPSGEAVYVFLFKNVGGDTLIIDRVRAP